jgi:hypothetical protein
MPRRQAEKDSIPLAGTVVGRACIGASSWRHVWPNFSSDPNGNAYFLLLVDEHNRFMWVTVLASKDRAVEAIREFKQRAEGESRCSLTALRMDHRGEFNSIEFAQHCAE